MPSFIINESFILTKTSETGTVSRSAANICFSLTEQSDVGIVSRSHPAFVGMYQIHRSETKEKLSSETYTLGNPVH